MDTESRQVGITERQAPNPTAGTSPEVSSPPTHRGGGSRDEAASSVPLDQWRGFALVLVLISHGFFYTGKVAGIGRVGVNLFFFISGILVFRSLAQSSAPSAWTRARSFWWRRLRRLYPALLAYLVATMGITYALQDAAFAQKVPGIGQYLRSLPNGLLYYMNYTEPPSHPALHHLWSLATEAQFYLLGPVIFALGGASLKRRQWVWGGLLAIVMILGMLQPRLGDQAKYHFEYSVWPMMLGFVAEWSRARFELFFRLFWKPILASSLALFVLSMVVMVTVAKAKIAVVAVGAFMVVPCYCCYLVGLSATGRLGMVLQWLGERTYSIYLWQQHFTLVGYVPTMFHPLGAMLSCAIGAISFHYVEKPFLSRRSGRVLVSSESEKAKPLCEPSPTPAAGGR